MRVFRLFLTLSILGFMTGCATTGRELLEQRQSENNARYAGYAADGFTLDHRSPDPRPQRAWQFYYKQCELVSRNPYPDRDEYSCSDPW